MCSKRVHSFSLYIFLFSSAARTVERFLHFVLASSLTHLDMEQSTHTGTSCCSGYPTFLFDVLHARTNPCLLASLSFTLAPSSFYSSSSSTFYVVFFSYTEHNKTISVATVRAVVSCTDLTFNTLTAVPAQLCRHSSLSLSSVIFSSFRYGLHCTC